MVAARAWYSPSSASSLEVRPQATPEENPNRRQLRARARHRRLNAHSRVRATPMCAGAQCHSARACVWRAWVCTGGSFFRGETSLRTLSKAARDATHVPLHPTRRRARRLPPSGGALGSTAQRSTGRRSKAGQRRGTVWRKGHGAPPGPPSARRCSGVLRVRQVEVRSRVMSATKFGDRTAVPGHRGGWHSSFRVRFNERDDLCMARETTDEFKLNIIRTWDQLGPHRLPANRMRSALNRPEERKGTLGNTMPIHGI
jgi:hypothetical protein